MSTSLEARYKNRLDFLKEAISFSDEILRKRGRLLSRNVGSCHTNQVEELKDFQKFSFWSDTGQTMFGGNRYKIWFKRDGGQQLVLDFYYQASIEEGEVTLFDEQQDWQRAIKNLAKNLDKILAKMAAEKLAEEKRQGQVRKQEKDRRRLESQAERIGIRL